MSAGLVFLSRVHPIHSNKWHTAFDIQTGKERLRLKMNLLKAPKQQDGSQSHQGAWLALPYGCYWSPRSKMGEELCYGCDWQRKETIVRKAVTLLLKHTHSKTHHKNHISTHRGQLNKSRVPSTSSKWQQGLGSCSWAIYLVCLAPSRLPRSCVIPLFSFTPSKWDLEITQPSCGDILSTLLFLWSYWQQSYYLEHLNGLSLDPEFGC